MTLVEVREHGRVTVPGEVVAATPPGFWRSAECEVNKSAPDGEWTLKAGNYVGVSRIATPAGPVTLQIRPKLENADVFFMADYAYEQRHDPLLLLDHDDIDLAAAQLDPTACLLVWHARAIRQFASRWLRRGYRTRTLVLDGKIQGKVLVNRYVSDHLAVGDAARIPCRVQQRTQDTPNNRVLKAGLRYIASLSHNLPVPAAQRAVVRQVNAALPLFAQVADIRIAPSDIRATSTRGPQRHYATVLKATIGLLEGHLMGDDIGDHSNSSSFMWRMPILFQESVRGLLDSQPGLGLSRERPGTARIYDGSNRRLRSSKVDPDLILRPRGGHTLLIDTKYKDALPASVPDGDDTTVVGDRHRIKVTASDIYQVVAYRQHEQWPDSKAALLYPLVLNAGEQLPQPMEVRGFGIPVSVMFIDIGRCARINLPAFHDALSALVGTASLAG